MKYAQAIAVAVTSALITSAWWAIGTGIASGKDFEPALVGVTVLASVCIGLSFCFATYDNWNL